jgi:hypothetical protein
MSNGWSPDAATRRDSAFVRRRHPANSAPQSRPSGPTTVGSLLRPHAFSRAYLTREIHHITRLRSATASDAYERK